MIHITIHLSTIIQKSLTNEIVDSRIPVDKQNGSNRISEATPQAKEVRIPEVVCLSISCSALHFAMESNKTRGKS